MKTAIIVINYQTPWHLRKCLESVVKFTFNFHLILVQNAPDAKSISIGNEFKNTYPENVTVITHTKNLGFVGGINSAFEEAIRFERICFLNSDTIVSENWLDELNGCLDNNEKLIQISPDTNTLHLHRQGKFWRIVKNIKPLSWISRFEKPLKSIYPDKGFKEYKRFYEFPGGYCNVFKTEFIKERGYFVDPNIIHGYWDEFDITSYFRQFGIVGWTDKSYVYHFHNVSFDKINLEKKGLKERLMQLNGLYIMHKWSDYLRKELNEMNHDEILDRYDTHAMRMAIYYFGLITSKPSFKDYIESIPAKEIGEKFLK